MNRQVYRCISCGSELLESLWSLWSTLLVDGGLHEIESVYHICFDCGAISTYPPIPNNLLQAHYSSMQDIEALSFLRRSDAAFDFITAYVGKEFPSRVLDVGCGEGYLLSLFKRNGSSVVGVEPSIVRWAAAAERYEIKEIYPALEELKGKTSYFDLIILSHVLEHLNNPRHFMKDLIRLVKKTGVIYIEVPAINRAAEVSESVIHLTHIHHFTTSTLVEFCRQMGLGTLISSKDDVIDDYPCCRVLVKSDLSGQISGEGRNPLKGGWIRKGKRTCSVHLCIGRGQGKIGHSEGIWPELKGSGERQGRVSEYV